VKRRARDESSQLSVYPLPERLERCGLPSHLDVMPDMDGYKQIALFSAVSASVPRFLTTWLWDGTSGVQAVDPKMVLCCISSKRKKVRE
jgi:hypothetical protein